MQKSHQLDNHQKQLRIQNYLWLLMSHMPENG